jgi:hypothetical protein
VPTKTRINENSYKVKRNLDDIRDAAALARKSLDELEPIVLSRRNHTMNEHLYRLARSLAEIDRKARNARQGEYEQ